MGFQDLENFNRAMLVKQLWRIITRPQSLVAIVLKEKYFRLGYVLETSIKGNSSFMWRSILAAKKLVKQGARWCVCNGEKIKIWEDKWLTSLSSFQVQTPINQLHKEARLHSFIDGE